jgi:hypothetical protein
MKSACVLGIERPRFLRVVPVTLVTMIALSTTLWADARPFPDNPKSALDNPKSSREPAPSVRAPDNPKPQPEAPRPTVTRTSPPHDSSGSPGFVERTVRCLERNPLARFAVILAAVLGIIAFFRRMRRGDQ